MNVGPSRFNKLFFSIINFLSSNLVGMCMSDAPSCTKKAVPVKVLLGEKRMSEALVPVLVETYDAMAADAKLPLSLAPTLSLEYNEKSFSICELIELSSIKAKEDRANWNCLVWAKAKANSTLSMFNNVSKPNLVQFN